MSRRTIILLWLIFPVCILVAALYASYSAKSLVGVHRPLLTVELVPITEARQGRAIREMFRDLADTQRWALTDASDRYTTTAGNPELHLEASIAEGSLRFDSFYTRAPARVSFYGDVRSPALQNLMVKSLLGLKALGLGIRPVNAGSPNSLPPAVQETLKTVTQGG